MTVRDASKTVKEKKKEEKERRREKYIPTKKKKMQKLRIKGKQKIKNAPPFLPCP